MPNIIITTSLLDFAYMNYKKNDMFKGVLIYLLPVLFPISPILICVLFGFHRNSNRKLTADISADRLICNAERRLGLGVSPSLKSWKRHTHLPVMYVLPVSCHLSSVNG